MTNGKDVVAESEVGGGGFLPFLLPVKCLPHSTYMHYLFCAINASWSCQYSTVQYCTWCKQETVHESEDVMNHVTIVFRRQMLAQDAGIN